VFAVQGAGPAATYAPPSYADPGSFTEREVVVGPLDLPGTITMPKGKGPFPALVLVHGSGPNDRDESIGPNKPFKDLAWGLASRGVAVLRYDKRTKARPAECVRLGDRFTVQEEVIEDARAAVRLLAHTPGVDATRVFLLGHSLGGYLAPRIAEGAPELAGLVIMAGPVRPFEDLLVDQARYLGQVDGMPRDVLDQQVRDIQRRATRVKAPDLSPLTASASLPLGIPAPYWLDLRQVHPPQTARALGKPILVLQGERDYQVTTADFELWKQGLEGASVASYRLYPALNHLFQPGTGLCKPAEYQVPGHVLPEVVTDVAGWIRGGDAR